MRVATQDGSFHADEVFAVAVLQLTGEPVEVVRTRDHDLQAAADLRLDVGFACDPAAGHFDHHQREGAGERDNGIPYASFGLIWREHGARLCGDAAADLARGILEREIASAVAGRRAQVMVRDAITAAADPRLIELSENVPWKQVVVREAPEALFVIYPKRQGFGIETVNVRLGDFTNRKDLPEPWAGLDGPQMAALTGVEDALFCHAKRFLAVARSREGIGELARQALDS